MMKPTNFLRLPALVLIGGLCLLGATNVASAQATRTWVSGVGDDVNPCSRTAPCKTFAGAISKTAAGGEISVLDPGGFGAVTITKSISLVSDGNEGSILVAGTPAITINAGASDVVSIYGLKLEGAGGTPSPGTYGIRVLQAGSVYISHTVIRGFKGSPGNGVSVESATNVTRVFLKDVEINNNNVGLYVHGGAATNAVFIDNCVLETNSSNTIFMDTSNSAASVFGSILAQTPVSLSNGAQLNSFGNNFIAGAVGPTGSVSLK
jgi:hypothetical protein